MPALGMGGHRGCTFSIAELAIPRQLAVHGLDGRGGEERRSKGGRKSRDKYKRILATKPKLPEALYEPSALHSGINIPGNP